MEKSSLPIAADHCPAKKASSKYVVLRTLVACGVLAYTASWFWNPRLHFDFHRPSAPTSDASLSKQHTCQQVSALWPNSENDKLQKAYDFLFTDQFTNASIARLSGAVQVKTESYDDLGVIGQDPRWDAFYDFHKYLEATFPRTHSELKVEKVNTHGLVYTWAGSDESKKPTVLMAHQDVVPVDPDTVDSWTHPPYSGFFDGTNIWGRGSSDCKNTLVGLMETVETLLEAEFKPTRTIVLSFGFDEECSGRQGAGHLAPFLHDRYGDNGVAVVVDEGMGYAEAFGRGYAVPGVAEKGYTDVDITVRTPGGHSSIPTDHTSIGILAEVIAAVEGVQYPTYLADSNPFLGLLQCGAQYSPKFPSKLKKLLKEHGSGKKTCAKKHKDRLAIEAAKLSRDIKYLMQTSQAVDVIKGGTKTNALPESAVVTINHRINIGDTPETVWGHIAHLVKPIAHKYNLALHAFDGENAAYKSISLSTKNTTLQVAPITPTDVDTVSPWSVLSGTIRALYGEDTIVAPALMTGNTDTRYYWDLTKNIFRFGPGYVKEDNNGLGQIHTVDEHVSVINHFKAVRWFTLFIRNMDGSDLE